MRSCYVISKGKLVASDSPKNLSRFAESTRNLEVTVKGEKSILEALMRKNRDILEFEIEDTQEDEVYKMLIKTKSEVDIREKVSVELANNRFIIFGMNMQELSLEDVFLELTKDGEVK
jgi:ABC-2 type transport system ATP-binding protein